MPCTRHALILTVLVAAPAPAPAGESFDPGSPQAVQEAMRLVGRAVALRGDGRLAGATAAATRAVELAPGAPGPRRLLGELHEAAGDCFSALEQLTAYTRLGREDKAVKQVNELIRACRTDGKRRGRLVVRVAPPAAALQLLAPGQEAPVASGQGNIDAELPSGSYRLLARLPGHEEVDVAVFAKAGATTTVAHSLVLRPAAITVVTVPPGADVKLDGEPVGRSPLHLEPVKPGDHEVVAELAGHAPARAQARTEPGQALRLELRPAPEPAKLRVTADVEQASVEVEGGAGCRLPCEVQVPAGRLGRLRLRAPGFLEATREVLAAPGQVGEVRVRLTPEPAAAVRRGQRSWGMALAAAGVALAAGGVVALLPAGGRAGTRTPPMNGTARPKSCRWPERPTARRRRWTSWRQRSSASPLACLAAA